MRNSFLLGMIVVLLLSLVAAPALAAGEIRLGLITPLTGSVSSYGISVKNAVTLAVERLNEAGGVAGSQLKLFVEDDKGDPIESANAAMKLINREKVDLIVGPVITPCVTAVAPICQDHKVPMITPTGTGDKLTDVGDYIFRACFKDSFQGTVMARYAYERLGLKRAAIIYDIANPYSAGLMNAFKQKFTELGGKITTVQSYSTGDMDFSAQITSIIMSNPEALFVPTYHDTAGPIVLQARQQGFQGVFLGVDGWDSPDLAELAGGHEEGAYIVNHYSLQDKSETSQSFVAAYRSAFNRDPDALAALGYDAVLIVAEALKLSKGQTGAALKDALGKAQNIEGATGTINMDPSGTPVKAAVILQRKDGQWVLVDKINP